MSSGERKNVKNLGGKSCGGSVMFEVETCEVTWNMREQCFEVLIIGKRDGLHTRMFIPDLGKNFETKLQRAENIIRN